MKPEAKSPLSQAEFEAFRGQYPILESLAHAGVPLTKEEYIRANWNGEPQDERDAEFQAMLPPPFRGR